MISGSISLYIAISLYLRFDLLHWTHVRGLGSAPTPNHVPPRFLFSVQYPINRYAMETKRQLDVLDKNLATRTYIAGEEYTLADIAIWCANMYR